MAMARLVVLVVVSVVFASVVAAQSADERRALDLVNQAVRAFSRAGTIQAAQRIRDASENAWYVYREADRIRDEPDALYHSRLNEALALSVTCEKFECNGVYLVVTPATQAQELLFMEAHARVSAANAEYLVAVGMSDSEARQHALSWQSFARRKRRLPYNDVEANNAIKVETIRLFSASDELHSRAEARHVAANSAVLETLRNAARTMTIAALRLVDYNHPGASAVTDAVSRLRESSDIDLAEIAGNGDDTYEALDAMSWAINETYFGLESLSR